MALGLLAFLPFVCYCSLISELVGSGASEGVRDSAGLAQSQPPLLALD
jgi:hypothetical protein